MRASRTPVFNPVLRRELTLYFSAQSFLTRLPTPSWIGWEEDRLARAARYFPLVGLIVGGASGLVFALASPLGAGVAAGAALGVGALLTGALHEDGFADCCDGLGGGATRERALEIMRDSRIGAFGAVGLTLIILIRWSALSGFDAWAGALAVAAAWVAARAGVVLLLRLGRYARADGAASGVSGGVGWGETAAALILAGALAALAAGVLGLAALALAVFVALFWLLILNRKLGGYTGDGLGAAILSGETAALIALSAAP